MSSSFWSDITKKNYAQNNGAVGENSQKDSNGVSNANHVEDFDIKQQSVNEIISMYSNGEITTDAFLSWCNAHGCNLNLTQDGDSTVFLFDYQGKHYSVSSKTGDKSVYNGDGEVYTTEQLNKCKLNSEIINKFFTKVGSDSSGPLYVINQATGFSSINDLLHYVYKQYQVPASSNPRYKIEENLTADELLRYIKQQTSNEDCNKNELMANVVPLILNSFSGGSIDSGELYNFLKQIGFTDIATSSLGDNTVLYFDFQGKNYTIVSNSSDGVDTQTTREQRLAYAEMKVESYRTQLSRLINKGSYYSNKANGMDSEEKALIEMYVENKITKADFIDALEANCEIAYANYQETLKQLEEGPTNITNYNQWQWFNSSGNYTRKLPDSYIRQLMYMKMPKTTQTQGMTLTAARILASEYIISGQIERKLDGLEGAEEILRGKIKETQDAFDKAEISVQDLLKQINVAIEETKKEIMTEEAQKTAAQEERKSYVKTLLKEYESLLSDYSDADKTFNDAVKELTDMYINDSVNKEDFDEQVKTIFEEIKSNAEKAKAKAEEEAKQARQENVENIIASQLENIDIEGLEDIFRAKIQEKVDAYVNGEADIQSLYLVLPKMLMLAVQEAQKANEQIDSTVTQPETGTVTVTTGNEEITQEDTLKNSPEDTSETVTGFEVASSVDSDMGVAEKEEHQTYAQSQINDYSDRLVSYFGASSIFADSAEYLALMFVNGEISQADFDKQVKALFEKIEAEAIKEENTELDMQIKTQKQIYANNELVQYITMLNTNLAGKFMNQVSLVLLQFVNGKITKEDFDKALTEVFATTK